MKVERSEGFKLNVAEMFVISGLKKVLWWNKLIQSHVQI